MAPADHPVAIVTGASSGIGEAAAHALAPNHRLVLAARRRDRLAQLRRTIETSGGTAIDVGCDVSNRRDVQALVRAAMDAFGRIDVLINNAGVMANAPMIKCRVDDWDAMIDINLRGLLYCTGETLPILLRQKTGHIVNVSSVAGRKIFNGAAVYCGTKHAVHVISDALRGELAESAPHDGNRIRVSVIAPGVVITELPESIRDPETREISKKYYASIPEPLTSEDVANAIAFAVNAPAHVGINEILLRPLAQVR